MMDGLQELAWSQLSWLGAIIRNSAYGVRRATQPHQLNPYQRRHRAQVDDAPDVGDLARAFGIPLPTSTR